MNEFYVNGKEKSEDYIQTEVVAWFQERGIFCHSVPNEAKGRKVETQSRLVKMGLRGGVADLVVWWKVDGKIKIGYVELKDRKGTLKKKQIVFREICAENGVSFHLARGIGDIEKITLEEMGFIPPARGEKQG